MKFPVTLPLVLAVAGSCWWARPALAQPAPAPPPPDAATPLFEIYGTVVPFLEYGKTSGATRRDATPTANQVRAFSGVNAPGRYVMDMGTSNLGFRGGLDLTDHLSVIWQVESGLQADGTTVANTIASRNSNIGLTGPWGTAFVGSWDTPFKWVNATTVNPIRAGFIPDYNAILSGPGFGISTVVTQAGRAAAPNENADAAFERRQGNSIQYWTPNYQGVSARLAYSIYEGRNANSAMAPSIKPQIFSASLAYERGPLKLRYAFEGHFDYFGMSRQGGSMADTATNPSSTDLGHRLVASYTNVVPGFDTRVVGVFEYLSYKNDDETPAGIDAHARAAYYGLVDQTLVGKHHIYVAFGQALDGSCSIVDGTDCSTEGLGASEGVIGYIYRWSKDVDFFAAGYRITNKSSASYSTFPPLGGPASPGADVQGAGIGMLYQFSATVSRGSKRPRHPTPAPAQPAPVPTPAPDITPGPTPPAPAPAAEPAPAAPPTPTPPAPASAQP